MIIECINCHKQFEELRIHFLLMVELFNVVPVIMYGFLILMKYLRLKLNLHKQLALMWLLYFLEIGLLVMKIL